MSLKAATRAPSEQMLKMLQGIAKGRAWNHHLRGRSEHGGGGGTLHALRSRGWLERGSDTLTAAGREVLAAAARRAAKRETRAEREAQEAAALELADQAAFLKRFRSVERHILSAALNKRDAHSLA
jgi:hypothetical protein